MQTINRKILSLSLTKNPLFWLLNQILTLFWPNFASRSEFWPFPKIRTYVRALPILTSRNASQLFHDPACFVGFIPELSCIFFLSFNIGKLSLNPTLDLAGIDVRTFFLYKACLTSQFLEINKNAKKEHFFNLRYLKIPVNSSKPLPKIAVLIIPRLILLHGPPKVSLRAQNWPSTSGTNF